MAEIVMRGGFVVRLDDGDLPLVAGSTWHAMQLSPGRRYAAAKRKGKIVLMHRLILGVAADEDVDHADGDPLNNSRSNLRIATHQENMRNRGTWGAAGFKGVHFDSSRKRSKQWRARIGIAPGKQRNLGRFATAEEAARAYDDAARELFGDFARLNFPVAHERAA